MNRGLPARGRPTALVVIIGVVGVVGVSLAPRARAEGPVPPALPACGAAGLDEALLPRLRLGEFLDVHHLSVTLDAVCAADATHDRRRIVDALALFELDEPLRARGKLVSVSQNATDESTRRWAAIVLAWSFLRDGDGRAFEAHLSELPPEARARLTSLAHADDGPAFAGDLLQLPDSARAELDRMDTDYRAARHTRRPWLAGTLSAALPGAGQVYAGSWQAALVSFVLNGALIGATAELAARRLYFPATAAGLAASFFYVGNIFNAADLADKRNQRASQIPYRELETRLVPEARP